MLSLSDELGFPNVHTHLEKTLRSVQRTITARNDDKQRCMESLMFRRALRASRKMRRIRNDNLRRRLKEKMVKEAQKRANIEKRLKRPCPGAIPVAVEGAANNIVPIVPPYDAKAVAVPKKEDLVLSHKGGKGAVAQYRTCRRNALNYYRGLFESDPLFNKYEGMPVVWNAFTSWFSDAGTGTASLDPPHGFCRVKGVQLLNLLNQMTDKPKEFHMWVRRGVNAMKESGDIGALPERPRELPPLPPPPLPPLPAGAPPPEAATPGALALGEGPLALAEVTPAKKKLKTSPDLEPGSAPKESTGPAAVAGHTKKSKGA